MYQDGCEMLPRSWKLPKAWPSFFKQNPCADCSFLLGLPLCLYVNLSELLWVLHLKWLRLGDSICYSSKSCTEGKNVLEVYKKIYRHELLNVRLTYNRSYSSFEHVLDSQKCFMTSKVGHWRDQRVWQIPSKEHQSHLLGKYICIHMHFFNGVTVSWIISESSNRFLIAQSEIQFCQLSQEIHQLT